MGPEKEHPLGEVPLSVEDQTEDQIYRYLVFANQGRADARQSYRGQAVQYALTTPERYFAAYTALQDPLKLQRIPGASVVLERMTDPELVRKAYRKRPRIADEQTFRGILNGMETQDEQAGDLAEQMLIGCFDQSTDLYRKNYDRPEGIVQAQTAATETGYALASALYRKLEVEGRRVTPAMKRALINWNTNALAARLEERDTPVFVRLLEMARRNDAEPELQEKADAVLQAMEVMESVGLHDTERPQMRYAPRLGKWESPLQKKKNQIQATAEGFVKDRTQTEAIVTIAEPERLPLANDALFLKADGISRALRFGDIRSYLIRGPGGTIVNAHYHAASYQGQYPDYPYEAIAKEVREVVTKPELREGMPNTMTPNEANEVITWLSPEGSYAGMRERAEVLHKKVWGLHAVGRRGVEVQLRERAEKPLQDMGLSSFTFRQTKDGIAVDIAWGKWKFQYALDREYNVRGLEGMSPENQDWLKVITYAYLSRVKNPDDTNVIVTEQAGGRSGDPKPPEKVYERVPHLRVLPVGDQARETQNEFVNYETQFHFGVSLAALNEAFISIQKNRRSLEQYDPVMQNLLIKLMGRVQRRPEQPVWFRQSGANGEEVESLFITNPEGLNIKRPEYMVTYVSPVERPGEAPKPIKVRCPGAVLEVLPEQPEEPTQVAA